VAIPGCCRSLRVCRDRCRLAAARTTASRQGSMIGNTPGSAPVRGSIGTPSARSGKSPERQYRARWPSVDSHSRPGTGTSVADPACGRLLEQPQPRTPRIGGIRPPAAATPRRLNDPHPLPVRRQPPPPTWWSGLRVAAPPEAPVPVSLWVKQDEWAAPETLDQQSGPALLEARPGARRDVKVIARLMEPARLAPSCRENALSWDLSRGWWSGIRSWPP
jgi:hypothetical protein